MARLSGSPPSMTGAPRARARLLAARAVPPIGWISVLVIVAAGRILVSCTGPLYARVGTPEILLIPGPEDPPAPHDAGSMCSACPPQPDVSVVASRLQSAGADASADDSATLHRGGNGSAQQ
jgi:hypothetical protein